MSRRAADLRSRVGRLWRRSRTLLYTPRQRRHALVGPGELWRAKRRFQIEFLRAQGLEPHHHLLDLGCGTLRGGVPLIAYLEPGHYWGVDVRDDVLAAARRELAAEGLEGRDPTVMQVDDLATVDLGRRFDVVWAFSVLFHMDDDVLDGALGFVARHLADEGRFLANVLLGDRAAGEWHEFPVVYRRVETYRSAAAAHGLTVAELGPLAALGHRTGRAGHDDAVMLLARHAGSR